MAFSMQLRAPARGAAVARNARPTRVALRSRKAVVVEAVKKSVGDLTKADLEVGAHLCQRLRCARAVCSALMLGRGTRSE
jgi:hypothetical protein